MIKTLLIILSILTSGVTLSKEDSVSHSKTVAGIISMPKAAALNIMTEALSSVKKLQKQGLATPENIKKLIGAKLLPNIDIDAATHLVLKKHLSELNNTQIQLFERYIIHSLIKDYSGMLGSYDKLDSIKVTAEPNVKRKGAKAKVNLIIALGGASKPAKVTLKMIQTNQWRIYDIAFLGVSLIKTYRAQFNSHIRRKGVDSLIEKISKKLLEG
ncbi:MAG: ABC transporter substrate-binding protein [Gammaproteobacteria bacterium]|nr:ABC transporter substrate-binding protein [Gammaproteobacteria bacterium]